jgi:glycosyltransferase involved in cell wall biosynthesis
VAHGQRTGSQRRTGQINLDTLKRVIFTVTNDLTYDRRMQRICKTLSAHGFQVTLVGRKLRHSVSLEKKSFEQIRLQCFFNKGKLFYIEYNIRLFWLLIFLKADIFCAIDLDTIVPVFWVSFFKRKKRFFDAHEYFEEVPEVVRRKSVQWVWRMVARIYVRRFHVCYTVSQSLADEFRKYYMKHFEVVRNVPDLIEKENVNEGKYLLYQGALNEGRGLELLIEAMQHIDIPLKIAGEGDLSDELRLLMREKELDNKIEFLGFVPPDNLPALTENAFAGLNLLENKCKSYYYSLANKYFDYMQAEVPVITMNFPEYRNINALYETAVLLHELSVDSICEAVKKLKNEKTLYLKLKQSCRQAKKEFNWQRESKKLISLYK